MESFPVPGFKICLLPVRVGFAMMINKAQKQLVSGKIGFYIFYACLLQGQLYVAMSRTTYPRNIIILIHSVNKSSVTVRVTFNELILHSSTAKIHVSPSECWAMMNQTSLKHLLLLLMQAKEHQRIFLIVPEGNRELYFSRTISCLYGWQEHCSRISFRVNNKFLYRLSWWKRRMFHVQSSERWNFYSSQ